MTMTSRPAMGSPIRVVADDARGNPVARYEQNGPDHYAHAAVYAEVAGARQPREAGVLMIYPRAATPVITQRRARHGESPDPFATLRGLR